MTELPELEHLEAEVGGGLDALIAGAESRVAALARRRAELDGEIAQIVRRIRAWEGARDALDPAHARHVDVDDEPTKREAVLKFLNENPERDFRLVEIRHSLVARGWIRDDRKAIHALEVAVTGMAERGEIARVRKGVYRLKSHAELGRAPDAATVTSAAA